MTRESYDAILIGAPIGDVEKQVGRPYSIRSKGGEIQEYSYTERINVGDDLSIENVYYLEVLHGVVVGKRSTSKRSPAYNMIYQTDPNFTQ